MKKNIAFEAMEFAKKVHSGQVRAYTGEPYDKHLAEVVAITASVLHGSPYCDKALAIAWLHGCIETCGVTYMGLRDIFGSIVADGVMVLSNLEGGNREERKRLEGMRLFESGNMVQTIKCAVILSNLPSIIKHDPEFAVTYTGEVASLLDCLGNADVALRGKCRSMLVDYRTGRTQL